MQPKQHIARLLSILACMIIASSSAYGQEEKKILMIPGDIQKPYDVIDCVAFVKQATREVSLFGSDVEKTYNGALSTTFKDLEDAVRKAGADAVINMQLQFVVWPTSNGNAIHLLVFGKVVKFKPEK
jgi:uncharacterized protein YbjQ (UPF0145 family)